jgi:ElaB/YqjD/DUF883 family membrane-anchored ribosome-binding protein
MQQFERAGGKVASDFRAIIADGEDLLKAAATVSGEGLAVARTRFEGQLKNAKAALADASQPVLERTRETAAAADEYVRGNPWSAVGIALAAGVLVGYLAGRK